MNFLDFKPDQYRKEFRQATEGLSLSLQAGLDDQDQSGLQLLSAVRQSIDIMERADMDRQNKNTEPLNGDEVTEIGGYALSLLEELSAIAANRGLRDSMLVLQRLAIPVALWVARHGGNISRLDIVVNAFAGYANDLRQPDLLMQLSDAIEQVVDAVADDIRRDLETTNPMRPWRILNLNWGIVATRSHNVDIMERVFERLLDNIPADVKSFFQEGMQQMDIVGYPDPVREVMTKYNRLVGNSDALH